MNGHTQPLCLWPVFLPKFFNMKRRDFVRTTLGVSLLNPLETFGEAPVTHLDSEDLTGQAGLANDYSLYFMAIGDWGRSGEYPQLEVGKQMGQWATTHRNSFVISRR